jgi:hypothetical protein
VSEVNKALIATHVQLVAQAQHDLKAFMKKVEETESPWKIGDLIKEPEGQISIQRVTLYLGNDNQPTWGIRGKLLKKDGSVGLRNGTAYRRYE